MTEGTQIEPVEEISQQKPEIQEALAELNKSTYESPAKVEDLNVQTAEKVQEDFTTLVDAAASVSVGDGRPATEYLIDEGAAQLAQEQSGATDGQSPEDPIPAGENIKAGGVSDLKETLAPFRNNIGELREFVAENQNAISEGGMDPAGEIGGKSDFGTGTSPASDQYSGVNMTQGEVAQNSDWNEGSEPGSDQAEDTLSEGEEDNEAIRPVPPPKDSPDVGLGLSGGSDGNSVIEEMIDNLSGDEDGGLSVNAGAGLSAGAEIGASVSAGEDSEADVSAGSGASAGFSASASAGVGDTGNGGDDGNSEEVGGYQVGVDLSGLDLTGGEASGESNEFNENQIVIPAGKSQIDFAGVAREVQVLDDFTWKLSVAKDETGDFRVPTKHPTKIEPLPERTASGDHHKTPGDSEDFDFRQTKDPHAYDPNAKPEKVGSKTQAYGITVPVERSDGSDDWQGTEPRILTDISTSPAGLRKYGKDSVFIVSDLLNGSAENPGKLTLEDLVLSVMPWPFHKDLPDVMESSTDKSDGIVGSLSIPIVSLTSVESLIEILENLNETLGGNPDLEDEISKLEDIIDDISATAETNPEDYRHLELNDEMVMEIIDLAEHLNGLEENDQDIAQNEIKKLPLGDLVLSVLPWPFHKELPATTTKSGDDSSTSKNLPLEEIMEILFRWMPYLVSGYPIPGLKEKGSDDDN